MGGAMDLIPPLGVYAAMLREQGRPLDFPGGAARVAQAVDVDLLARAIAWSGEAESRAQRSLQRHQWRCLHLGEHLAGDRGCAGHEAGQARAAVDGEGISELDRAVGRAAAQA